MTCASLLYDLDAAAAEYAAAETALRAALRLAYPVGCEVWVKIGRHGLRIRITGHGSPSSPGGVVGVNVATGKRRKFHHAAIFGFAG